MLVIKCVECKTDLEPQSGKSMRRLCDKCRVIRNKRNYKKHNNEKKKYLPDFYIVKCRYCSSIFRGKTINKKYCSNSCRTAFFNIPNTITATEERIERLYIKLFQLREKLEQ